MLRCGIVDSISINHRVTQVTDKGDCSELQLQPEIQSFSLLRKRLADVRKFGKFSLGILGIRPQIMVSKICF